MHTPKFFFDSASNFVRNAINVQFRMHKFLVKQGSVVFINIFMKNFTFNPHTHLLGKVKSFIETSSENNHSNGTLVSCGA